MSVTIRLLKPLTWLAMEGLIELRTIDESVAGREALSGIHVVALSRSYSAAATALIRLAKRDGTKILYDIDDDLFFQPHWMSLHGGDAEMRNFAQQIELADQVTVSVSRLAHRLCRRNPNIRVIPNSIDFRDFPSIANWPGGPLRVVLTNLMNLKLETARREFVQALRQFQELDPGSEIHLFGDVLEELAHLPRVFNHGFLPYDAHKRELCAGRYSFAICPLGGPEDRDAMPHNVCKSPLKYLEYGAAQIPGIYSNTPAYADEIKNRVTGLLVENTGGAWFEAMRELAASEDLKSSIASNAISDIRERFDIRHVSDAWLDAIRALL